MLLHPWISDRLAAQHRADLSRVAPRHRAKRSGVARDASAGPLARRLGNALIAVGRRLAPDTPTLGPALTGGRGTH